MTDESIIRWAVILGLIAIAVCTAIMIIAIVVGDMFWVLVMITCIVLNIMLYRNNLDLLKSYKSK